MALSGQTVWEVRTTGSDTLCSGGFNPANANFATDGTATIANTGSPVFTSATYNFVASDVGTWLFIKSGTNWTPGWYQIASVAVNAATLSAAIGEGVLYGGAQGTTNQALSFIPSTLAGCATTASPTGATWGVDYSQQDGAKIPFTDMIIGVTTTTFTSVLNPVGKNMIGNLIRVTSGTGFTVQTVEIVSTATITATCDKSLGTTASVGGNGYLGGAYAGPQLICGLTVVGNLIFNKSGAYTISNTSNNTSNGIFTIPAIVRLIGYNSQRGDAGTRPVFTASGISGVAMITASTTSILIKNISLDAASLGTMTGFSVVSSTLIINSKVSNAVSAFPTAGCFYLCEAASCTNGFGNGATLNGGPRFCIAKNCTTGFAVSSANNCLAHTCTTGFINLTANGINLSFCNSYNCGTGFQISIASTGSAAIFRCLAHTSSGRGFDITVGVAILTQCAGYANSLGDIRYSASVGSWSRSDGFIALSVDPCTNVAGDDFSLNNVAGGGALLRQLVYAFPSLINTNTYPDVGMAQHLEASSGGSFPFC